MSKPANFSIVQETVGYILIRDEGPWDQHLTVTNDAEGVVIRLQSRLNGRRLFCIDSYGETDELKVDNMGRFGGFAFGGPEKMYDADSSRYCPCCGQVKKVSNST